MDVPERSDSRPAGWRQALPYIAFIAVFLTLFVWQRGRSRVHRLMEHRASASIIAERTGLTTAVVLAVGYQLGEEFSDRLDDRSHERSVPSPETGLQAWGAAAARYAELRLSESPTIAAIKLSGHGALVARMRAGLAKSDDVAALDQALRAQPEAIAVVQMHRMESVFEDLLSP